MKNQVSGRIEWVDTAKALACFLVVLGHLLQSLYKITPDNALEAVKTINYVIYLFHMPLFFCLSGYLYFGKKKIDTAAAYFHFEIKKVINLSVPYVTFYSVTVLLNMVFSDSVNSPKGMKEWLGIFNDPISPYWFLYALLAIFLVVPLLEKPIKDKRILLALFFLLKIGSVFISTKVYFVDALLKNGIWFCLGAFVPDGPAFKKRYLPFLFAGAYLAAAVLLYGACKKSDLIYEAVALFLGAAGTGIVIEIMKGIQTTVFLNSFKKYTFQIFLTHTIFAAGVRIVLFKLKIESYAVHLAIGLIAGLYLPVLLSVISHKLRFTDFFFFPLKTISSYKNKKET